MVKSLCVFCGSAKDIKPFYHDEAKKVSKLLVESDITLVYGGGGIGLMGTVADAVMDLGGRAIGVMTKHIIRYEAPPKHLTELLIVDTMHERKQKMFDESDGFIILPGGVGTLDEVMEIITWKQLGMHKKPIVFLNTNNFWSNLIGQLQMMEDDGFMPKSTMGLFSFVPSVDLILSEVAKSPDCDYDPIQKWM